MDAQQLAQAIIQATAVTADPLATAQRRAEAVQFFEQLKHGEIHSTVHAAAVLTDTQYALEVQLSAYTLLQILVRNRWGELSPDEQQKITQLAYQHMKDVGHLGQSAAFPLKSKAALLLAAVTRQQGPETYSALLPQLVASAAEGPMQAEICCMVLQFVSEDITQFEERGGEWKRNYLSALSASVETVLPFLVNLLQESFQAGSNAANAQQAQLAQAHAAVVSAALGTLTGFVEWAPLTRLVNSGVIEACGFFIGVPDFRGAALGVIKQLIQRKASGKDVDEIAAVGSTMAKVADVLLNAAAALLAAPNAQAELEQDGSNEEIGQQLCGLMTTLADLHWAHVDTVQKQHQILRHMLEFLKHPYLPLAAAALNFWSTIVREAGGIANSTIKASPLQSPRDSMSADGGPAGGALTSSSLTAQQQQLQQGSQQQGGSQGAAAGGGVGQQPNNPATIPPEACQMVVQVLSEQLSCLPVRFDDVETPLWAESADDYKSSVVQFRSQAKLVMRAAARLAPNEVLSALGQLQQTCLDMASRGNSAAAEVRAGGPGAAAAQATLSKGQMGLETAVVLLESVLPSLCDAGVMSSAVPGFKESMVGLLQQLLGLRYTDPVMIALHARSLEAFSRLMPYAPEQIVPLISTSFECMSAVPLEQNGQLPPPAKVTWRWKEEAMARISMSKVLLNVAKEAPACFLPHLQSLVQQVEQLWAAGQLREPEKVALHEGLMVSVSRAGSLELQTQLLEWLLRPVHAKWTEARWLTHLDSPGAFAAEYMQYEVQPTGSVVVLSSPQRWSLHHEMQLFERVLRRTPAPTAAQQPQQQQPLGQPPQPQQQQPQPPQHPFAAHVEWSMVPLAAMIRCLHGLYAPDMQAQLSPLQAAFHMDPVEKALRMGGVREEAKKLEEDGGTIAGANIPALRHWLKSIRESNYLTLQFAGSHLGNAFWFNQRLAGIVPQALVSNIEVIEDRHLKLLFRHALTPFLSSCPRQVRPPWLLPILSRLLPHMHERLLTRWSQVQASAAGSSSGAVTAAAGAQQPAAANGSGDGGSGSQQQQQQQLSEEVVSETILRETTREYMALLTKITDRAAPFSSSSGSGSASGAAAASANGGGASGGAAAASAAAAAALAGPPPAAAAPVTAEQESVVETLWQYDQGAMRSLIAVVVAGMCWPDSTAAGKATRICMFLASLAESTHSELEALVLPDMLRSAMLSVVQVSSITIQADVLQLLRNILVTWLPRSELIRGVLLQLPHVTPQVLSSFQEQLLALNSEKDQRGIIKTLLAESGGESARAVLSAVSKVGAVPVTNLGDGKARREAGAAVVDELRWDWSEAGIAV